MLTFPKITKQMSSILPCGEFDAYDESYTAIPVLSATSTSITLLGNYLPYFDIGLPLDYKTASNTFHDVIPTKKLYDGTNTVIIVPTMTNTPTQILISAKNINGVLNTQIVESTMQHLSRLNVGFKLDFTLLDKYDENIYTDEMITILSQMNAIWYINKMLMKVSYTKNQLSTVIADSAASLSGESQSQTDVFKYLKKATAAVTNVEFGAINGTDLITAANLKNGVVLGQVEAKDFYAYWKGVMSTLHRAANQLMVDKYNMIIDYTWNSTNNNDFIVKYFNNLVTLDFYMG